jgi:hypothetical protein
VFTHASSQLVEPSGQLQLPSVQAWPSVHASSQAPQFSGSLPTSVQVPLHDSSPDGQLPHSPAEQLVPREHASPQRPQLALLVSVSTQTPSQFVWPDPQETDPPLPPVAGAPSSAPSPSPSPELESPQPTGIVAAKSNERIQKRRAMKHHQDQNRWKNAAIAVPPKGGIQEPGCSHQTTG